MSYEEGLQPPIKPRTASEAMSEAENFEGDPLDCPCIADMKNGPCGTEFVAAYRCFLDSKEEERGSDCYPLFVEMQDCMQKHPEEYKRFLEDEDEDEDAKDEDAKDKAAKEAGGDTPKTEEPPKGEGKPSA